MTQENRGRREKRATPGASLGSSCSSRTTRQMLLACKIQTRLFSGGRHVALFRLQRQLQFSHQIFFRRNFATPAAEQEYRSVRPPIDRELLTKFYDAWRENKPKLALEQFEEM